MEPKNYKHCNISIPCPNFSAFKVGEKTKSKSKKKQISSGERHHIPSIDTPCTTQRLPAGSKGMDCKFFCRGLLKLILWSILFGMLLFLLKSFLIIYHKDTNHKGDSHPLISYIGMIIIVGIGTITFQVCNCIESVVQMLLHVFIFTVAIAIVVYDFMNIDKNMLQVQTLHGWLGYLTAILFIIIYFVGIISCNCRLFFNHTNCSAKYRYVALPGHVNISVIMYLLAIFTAITGIVDTANKAQDDDKLIINIFGLLTIFTGFIVVYEVEYSYTSEYEY